MSIARLLRREEKARYGRRRLPSSRSAERSSEGDAALREEGRGRRDVGDGDARGGEPMPFGPWGARAEPSGKSVGRETFDRRDRESARNRLRRCIDETAQKFHDFAERLMRDHDARYRRGAVGM